MYSFSYLEPVCCSMSSSNCCFLTCIQISQEAGKVVRYSHLLQNFPQFVVIHTVKRLWHSQWSTVDVFLELSSFFDDPLDVYNLISGSSIFSRSSLDMWKFIVHVLLKPGLENFEHYFTCMSEKAMATHSCTLVWWRSLVGCCPWGSEQLDTTEWLHFHFSLSCIGEGNGNPLQCSCLENSRGGRAWWTAISGVTQSRTRLKWLSSSSLLACEMSAVVWEFEHSLGLPFFAIGMKTDHF